MQGLEESLSEDQEMDEETASSFCWSCDSPIETMEESWLDSNESLKEQLQQAEAEITSLNEQTRLVKEHLQKLEEQIERLCKENEDLKSRRFCLENDDSISLYTGFPNMAAFQATLAYLNPGTHGEKLRYWRSSESNV